MFCLRDCVEASSSLKSPSTQKLRLYASELLHIQLDQFEEELEGDYEEMLSKFEKDKVLQRMESQGQSNAVEGDYLRVLLGHTGHQLIVPFEPTTTGKVYCSL